MEQTNQARWERLKQLCQTARELAPAERAAYLAVACAGDAALRREAETLLAYASRAESFIEEPAFKLLASEVAAESAGALSGQRINHYQIETLLGAGGMGEVYLARDTVLGRAVALKFLPVGFGGAAEPLRRFEQEARAASALNHPNILVIYEIGQVAGGPYAQRHFIASEYIEGQTLRARLRAGALDAAQTLNLAVQLASALAAAHAAGIIHRDLKPENIIVKPDGLVKLLDFGIAKLSAKDEGGGMKDEVGQSLVHPSPFIPHPSLTKAGVIVGTASYMSPEQARGLTVDARTDLFSLGLVIHEMVTGRQLFGGATRAQVWQVSADKEEAELVGAPKELEPILRKTIRRNPAERFASADELLAELRRLQRRRETKVSRRMLRFGAGALALAALFVAVAAWASFSETWEEKILRDGHTAGVRRAVFSPDGRLLVSVGEDGKVLVWDFARRELLRELTDHKGFVVAVSFAPDGKYFATASWDQTVIVWDAASLTQAAVLRDHHAAVTGVAFSPDGKYLATASRDPDDRAVLWRAGSWEKIRDLPLGSGDWAPLYFAPNNPRVLFNHAIACDVETGRKVDGLLHPIGSGAAFSPDGAWLVVVDSFGAVHFVDTVKQQAVTKPQVHRDNGRAAAFSPDGKLVVTGSEDIILWNAATQELILRWDYTSYVWSLAWSPDGRYVVSTHGDGSILLWDVVARERAANLNQHRLPVGAIAVSPDGRRIASGSEDTSIIIWNAATGRKEAVLLGHRSRITALAWSPDSQWLVSGDQQEQVIRWDLATRRERWRKQSADNSSLAISLDGRWIIGSRQVLDSVTGEMIFDFGTDVGAGGKVALSADGKRLVRVGFGSVSLWETGNWRLLGKQATSDDVISLAPDGKHFVTGQLSGELKLWQAEPLRPLGLLGRHKARVRAVVYSPDGQRLASISDDKTLKLWDVGARKLLQEIGTRTAPALALAFTPDGRQLVTGEHDHSVRLYTRQRTLWGWRLD